MPNEKSSRDALEIYLRDHYAGAVGALELLEHLSKAHAKDSLGSFFTALHADVQADHEQLHDFMSALGFEESNVRNAGAWMAEKFSRAKIGMTTGDDDLRLLQSLEVLYVGITGKKLLWRALRHSQVQDPRTPRTDFDHLEQRAIEQAERVEEQRLAATRAAFRGA